MNDGLQCVSIRCSGVRPSAASPLPRGTDPIDCDTEDLARRSPLVVTPDIFPRHAIDEREVVVRPDVDHMPADREPGPRILGADDRYRDLVPLTSRAPCERSFRRA